MSSSSWKKHNFPIHWLVWHNEYHRVDEELKGGGYDVEVQDPRGRTPLHLSVTLGHLECTRVLLRHGANANAENSKYWTVVQEAISTGDPEIVQLCLQSRDYQRHSQRTGDVPSLLKKLREAPDFYVEMKWEFTSWVPLISRICPSDTYKVWKSGANVRIDTTLLGFDNMNWLRGSRSFIFKSEHDVAVAMEVDHDAKQVWSEVMRVLPPETDASFLAPADEAVAARLTSPIATTYIDTDKISFERNKAGIWGWRSDKVETVNGYDCKVFNACNVELVTKTRTEHLTDRDKQQSKKNSKNPLESILSVAEREEKVHGAASNGDLDVLSYNPCHITPEEYFDEAVDLEDRDIGRPIEQSTKTQSFKATLWLCEDYPLSLPQQVLPIIDLMAASNAHFRRLKNFITLQLPSGFPVKIEIPLFHVLNARITFGNIFASDTPVDSVVCLHGQDDDMQCHIDESCFEPPSTYSVIGDSHQPRLRDEDDELLQFAIRQSVMDAGTEKDQVTFWEALDRNKPVSYAVLESEEERLLQRAIEESMRPSSCSGSSVDTAPVLQVPFSHEEEQLRLALELSQKYQEEAEKRRQEEEEELQKILALSLMEK